MQSSLHQGLPPLLRVPQPVHSRVHRPHIASAAGRSSRRSSGRRVSRGTAIAFGFRSAQRRRSSSRGRDRRRRHWWIPFVRNCCRDRGCQQPLPGRCAGDPIAPIRIVKVQLRLVEQIRNWLLLMLRMLRRPHRVTRSSQFAVAAVTGRRKRERAVHPCWRALRRDVARTRVSRAAAAAVMRVVVMHTWQQQ